MKKRFDWNGFFGFGDTMGRVKACRSIGERMAGDVEKVRTRGFEARNVAPRGRRKVLSSIMN